MVGRGRGGPYDVWLVGGGGPYDMWLVGGGGDHVVCGW